MRSHVRALIVFAGALAIKGAVLFALYDHPLLQPRGELDPVYYVQLGQRVANGDLLLAPEPFFLSPLYIYFLGAVFAAGGGVLAARIVQIVLGALAVALVSETARDAFGARAGWVAGGLAALTGAITFYEVTLLQSSLDPILVAATMFFLRRRDGARSAGEDAGVPTALRSAAVPAAERAASRRLDVLGGLCAGLLVLNRPNVLLWLAVYGLWLLWRERARALPFLIAAALVIAPVTLRNWMVSRELILVSSHGGLNLFIGNNAAADGTYRRIPGIRPDIRGQHVDAERVAERAEGRELTMREVSSHFSARAFAWMRDEPLAATRLFLRKLFLTLNQADIRLNHSYDYFAADPPLLLLVVGPWLLFPLAAIAAPRAPRALLSFAIVYGVSVAIFFVSTRYRVPLLVAAAPMAGGGAVLLFEKQHRWRRLAAAAIVAAIVIWDPKIDRGVAVERADMVFLDIAGGRAFDAKVRIDEIALTHPAPATLFLQAGNAFDGAKYRAEAIAMWERSLLADRGDPESQLEASVRLVEAYIAGGRREDAMRLARSLEPSGFDAVHAAWIGRNAVELRDAPIARAFLRRVIELRPDSAEAHHNLGTAYVMSGERALAIESLETARRLDPGNASTLVNLAVLQAENGDYASARRNAEEALRVRPGSAQAERLLRALPR